MTTVGIIADIHADAEALREALAHMNRLGCARILCAGDIVGYGSQPGETVALLRENRVVCIRGNHDRWAVQYEDQSVKYSETTLDFLRSLRPSWHHTVEGVRLAMYHGWPSSDMDSIHPDDNDTDALREAVEAAGADVMIVGHSHTPFEITYQSCRIINPGALLHDTAPGDEAAWHVSAGGTFGTLELPSMAFRVFGLDGAEMNIIRHKDGGHIHGSVNR